MRGNNWHLAMGVGLALAGALSGAPAHAAPPPADARAGQESARQSHSPPRFHEIVARMSPEGRAIMVEAVRKSAPEKQSWRELKAAREEILMLIAAPDLDAAALSQAFERERTHSLALQAGRHAALLKAARRLSHEDRQIFADALRATRLHIPGETIKQIQKQLQKTKDSCPPANRDGKQTH